MRLWPETRALAELLAAKRAERLGRKVPRTEAIHEAVREALEQEVMYEEAAGALAEPPGQEPSEGEQ